MTAYYENAFAQVNQTLTDHQRLTYERDGALVVKRFLSEEQVAQAKDAWAQIVHQMRGDVIAHRDDRVTYRPPVPGDRGNYGGAMVRRPNSKCLLLFEHSLDPLTLEPEEAELRVRNLAHYEKEHPFFEELAAAPMILDVARQLIDDDPLLFQTMALAKPPKLGSEKPWHQDDAYFKYGPLEKVVGLWIALDDANIENGCMHILPGAHRRVFKHISTFDCQISPDRISDRQPQAVELPAGGAMFFSGLLPHQTPPNRSDRRRRALQFHYRGASTREMERADYDKLFAEPDGTPGSCAAASAPGQ